MELGREIKKTVTDMVDRLLISNMVAAYVLTMVAKGETTGGDGEHREQKQNGQASGDGKVGNIREPFKPKNPRDDSPAKDN